MKMKQTDGANKVGVRLDLYFFPILMHDAAEFTS